MACWLGQETGQSTRLFLDDYLSLQRMRHGLCHPLIEADMLERYSLCDLAMNY